MIDSSSASARARSSVVMVDGEAFNPRTRSSISSMSARRTRLALRSLVSSGVEMTSSPLTSVYLTRGTGVPPPYGEYTPLSTHGEPSNPARRRGEAVELPALNDGVDGALQAGAGQTSGPAPRSPSHDGTTARRHDGTTGSDSPARSIADWRDAS